MKQYTIEFYMPPPVDKWSKMTGFSYMRKTFADGAWAMLKSHYNQQYEHRLSCDGEIIEQIGKQNIKLNVVTTPNTKTCENCHQKVNIDDNTGHGKYCDYVYGRRGWRQLGAYDG